MCEMVQVNDINVMESIKMNKNKKCLECNEEFIVKGLNQYGEQKFCSEKCRREYHSKKDRRRKAAQGGASKKLKKNKKDLNEVSLNGLNGDLKAIEKYKKLSQNVVILMRKKRILKYDINTQHLILKLMEACYKHLDNELNKKEVVSVDWSE